MKDATSITPLPDVSVVALPARAVARSRLVDFFELTKPRMNFLVVITTAVGYYMAVRHPMDWFRLLHTVLGTALTAAAASTLNQWFERRHDAKMMRTAGRPLPRGRVTPGEALLFASILGVAGVLYLATAVNVLTALLGAGTLLAYVFVYTPLKRVTSLNTVIGAVPGAIPPLMGFTAVYNAITPEGVALFLILFVWQMPHFLAIAILCRDDYARAGFKMLPVIDPDLRMTARQIVLYSAALVPVTLLPTALGMTDGVYFVLATILGLGFFSVALAAAASRDRADARKLFLASILYLPLLLAGMMIDKL